MLGQAMSTKLNPGILVEYILRRIISDMFVSEWCFFFTYLFLEGMRTTSPI